jgi:glutamine amidotransferase
MPVGLGDHFEYASNSVDQGRLVKNGLVLSSIADVHGHAKGEHAAFACERPIAYTPQMLFAWFLAAVRRGHPRRLLVSDHINYITAQDAGAVDLFRRACARAAIGDAAAAALLAGVDEADAAAVGEGLRNGALCGIGIEADNDPRTPIDAPAMLDALNPDCVIRSVHFIAIDDPDRGKSWLWPFDNPEFSHVHDRLGAEETWERYVIALLHDLKTLRSDVVAHFYVPAKFGHWPSPDRLNDYEDRLVEVCSARGIAIELNTRPIYRAASSQQKTAYVAANRRLLAKAKVNGVAVAVGSDAHTSDDQARAFEIACELLVTCGIDQTFLPVKALPRIGMLTLGAANGASLAYAIERAGGAPIAVDTAQQFGGLDALIIPGVANVGFLADAIDRLCLRAPLLGLMQSRLPILGICAGFQILFEGTHEAPTAKCLGVFKGMVRSLRGPKTPHMGWNYVESLSSALTSGWAYFAHSYAPEPGISDARALTEYGGKFASVAGKDRILGVQFHPERSGAYGAALLRTFVDTAKMCGYAR